MTATGYPEARWWDTFTINSSSPPLGLLVDGNIAVHFNARGGGTSPGWWTRVHATNG